MAVVRPTAVTKTPRALIAARLFALSAVLLALVGIIALLTRAPRGRSPAVGGSNAALGSTHASVPAPSAAAVRKQLAGSPLPLRALHEQAGMLIGPSSGLTARLRALRGYPVVVNVWASWCGPCREEFPLLAVASARYGRRVAFLGADAEDQAGDARSFLAAHPVSYPSYPASTAALSSLAVIPGLPTTIFIGRSGKVAHVHIGQYGAQGTLDEDVAAYALGG